MTVETTCARSRNRRMILVGGSWPVELAFSAVGVSDRLRPVAPESEATAAQTLLALARGDRAA